MGQDHFAGTRSLSAAQANFTPSLENWRSMDTPVGDLVPEHIEGAFARERSQRPVQDMSMWPASQPMEGINNTAGSHDEQCQKTRLKWGDMWPQGGDWSDEEDGNMRDMAGDGASAYGQGNRTSETEKMASRGYKDRYRVVAEFRVKLPDRDEAAVKAEVAASWKAIVKECYAQFDGQDESGFLWQDAASEPDPILEESDPGKLGSAAASTQQVKKTITPLEPPMRDSPGLLHSTKTNLSADEAEDDVQMEADGKQPDEDTHPESVYESRDEAELGVTAMISAPSSLKLNEPPTATRVRKPSYKKEEMMVSSKQKAGIPTASNRVSKNTTKKHSTKAAPKKMVINGTSKRMRQLDWDKENRMKYVNHFLFEDPTLRPGDPAKVFNRLYDAQIKASGFSEGFPLSAMRSQNSEKGRKETDERKVAQFYKDMIAPPRSQEEVDWRRALEDDIASAKKALGL